MRSTPSFFAYFESRQEDFTLMLATQVYLGTQNSSKKMKPCTLSRNKKAIHYINLSKSLEKLMMANLLKRLAIKFTDSDR